MNSEAANLFSLFGAGAVLVLIVGFYSVLTTRNLIRILVGLEILTKAVTLLIIAAGCATGQIALAQALVITLIILEVSVVVVAVGIVLCIHKNTDSVDTSAIGNLKG